MHNFRNLAALLTLLALPVAAPASADPETVTLHHIHGLAYSADGERLMIPSHHGLAIYRDGRWSKAPGPEHDYMGFAATADALYSSGHPAPGSGLVNPFGLIRSDDGGQRWESLGLSGESDFHLLAASYRTNAVLVFNPAPNSRMKTAGLYVTLNDGFSWQALTMEGLSGALTSIAVHPDRPALVAAGTREGLFISDEVGAFRRVQNLAVTALWFDLADDSLWVGSHDGAPGLTRYDLATQDATPVTLPPLDRDAVAYIAQNPIHSDEYAIASFNRNVFVSQQRGDGWTPVARNGTGQNRND